MSEENIGKRYSHVYTPRGEPIKDSAKARFRLASFSDSYFGSRPGRSRLDSYKKKAIDHIEREIGIRFATKAANGFLTDSFHLYFQKVDIITLLDTITVLHSIREERYFLDEIRRIFEEENLSYTIDENGGVHPLIDSAFGGAMQSALSGLNGARYTATAAMIENIDSFLLDSPPDYKGAIRSVFGATENLFKLMFDLPRLDSQKAGDKLGQMQQRKYAQRSNLQSASSKTLASFREWINAAHFYRHEEGTEEASQPPEEIAILLISQGLAYVRWLAHLDKYGQ